MIKEKYLAKQRDLENISVKPPFPRILKIDICNTCNYCCVFCPQSKQAGKRGCIEKELCMTVIKDAYDGGARELCLSSTGEPLLNPELEEYAAYAKSLGYTYLFFNTNGYYMDGKRARRLLESGVDSIKFSINADLGSYQLVHGVDGYDRVIQNLKNLYGVRNAGKYGCQIYVSYIAVNQTKREADSLREKIANICDDFMVMNANNRAGSIHELDDKLLPEMDEYSYQYPCSQLFNNAYVTAEGYMVVCAQDFENCTVVADLHEENILSAWNNPMFTEFRTKYLKGDLTGMLCQNCIHNTSEPIKPVNEKMAGYAVSAEKERFLTERIEELVSRENM